MAETQRAARLRLQDHEDEATKALHMSAALLNQTLPNRPKAERDAARLALASGYHGTVFRGTLAKDPEAAQEYLTEHKAEMDPRMFERLQAAGQLALDKKASLELVMSVYDREQSKAKILQRIDDSAASERQKDIARQWADDQWEVDQARKKAAKRQQSQRAEEAVQAALQLYAEGVAFTDLPDAVLNAMTPGGRKAARKVYTQQLSGEAAPHNSELETELYEGWLKAITGKDDAFLKRPLAEAYGTHNPTRLGYWQQRKAELTSPDAETQAKINRRKPYYKMAERLLGRASSGGVDVDTRQAVIDYVDTWHDSNPGKVMEPERVKAVVEGFAGINDHSSKTPAMERAVGMPRMDEHGRWFDSNGNPIDDPDRDPNVHKVVLPFEDNVTSDGVGDDQLIGGAGDDRLEDDDDADIPDERLSDLESISQKIDEPADAQQSPDDLIAGMSKETIKDVGEVVLSLLPGTGNVMSARDAVRALIAAKEAAKKGEYSDAAIHGAFAALDIAGSLPGAGMVFRAAKQMARRLVKGKVQRGLEKPKDEDSQIGYIEASSPISLKKSDHLPESLDILQTRDVYKGRLRQAEIINSKIIDPVQGAKDANQIRNKERDFARSLMKDREEAANLARSRPNLTYQQALEKYSKEGLTGNALQDKVRKSAFKTNKEVDDRVYNPREKGAPE